MKVLSIISCDAALELISPFIDSMVSADQADSLRAHLSGCHRCRRELQSLASLRTVMAGVEPVPVPEDLQLETRIKLSHARSRNVREWWQSRVDNVLKPFAIPAVMGVFVTLLGFGILSGGLSRSVAAEELRPVATVYQQPRGTDSTMKRLGAVQPPGLDQAFSVQAEINDTGQMDGFSVISGTRSHGNDQWFQELVLLSQWRPATTYWGLPVRSRVILSFVTVRG
jgi:hypothetical protein